MNRVNNKLSDTDNADVILEHPAPPYPHVSSCPFSVYCEDTDEEVGVIMAPERRARFQLACNF